MSARKAGDLNLGLLVQKQEDAGDWDPNDVGSWNVRGDTNVTATGIYDRLYKTTEQSINLEITKRRLRISKGMGR